MSNWQLPHLSGWTKRTKFFIVSVNIGALGLRSLCPRVELAGRQDLSVGGQAINDTIPLEERKKKRKERKKRKSV